MCVLLICSWQEGNQRHKGSCDLGSNRKPLSGLEESTKTSCIGFSVRHRTLILSSCFRGQIIGLNSIGLNITVTPSGFPVPIYTINKKVSLSWKLTLISSHINPHNNEWFNFNQVIHDRWGITREPAGKLFFFGFFLYQDSEEKNGVRAD